MTVYAVCAYPQRTRVHLRLKSCKYRISRSSTFYSVHCTNSPCQFTQLPALHSLVCFNLTPFGWWIKLLQLMFCKILPSELFIVFLKELSFFTYPLFLFRFAFSGMQLGCKVKVACNQYINCNWLPQITSFYTYYSFIRNRVTIYELFFANLKDIKTNNDLNFPLSDNPSI
jgi:hypothetical protein